MRSQKLKKTNKILTILGLSFLIHLLILFILGKFIPYPELEKIYPPLELIPLPIEKVIPIPSPAPEKKMPAPAKPAPVKERALPDIPEKITRENYKMYEENLQGRESEEPQKTIEIPQRARDFTKPGGEFSQEAASEPQPDKTPDGKHAFQTEELFSRQGEGVPESKTGKNSMNFAQILDNLDKHINVEKYGSSGQAGIVSFDDPDFKSLWYGRIIKKRVTDAWFPPYAARALGLTGRSIYIFKIKRSGEITDFKLQDSSGDQSLDKAAEAAIKSASPFPQLPSDYKYDTLGVMFSFWYNLKPPRD